MVSLFNEGKGASRDKEDYEEDDDGKVKFTAEVHVNFIQQTFQYYSAIDYRKWI